MWLLGTSRLVYLDFEGYVFGLCQTCMERVYFCYVSLKKNVHLAHISSYWHWQKKESQRVYRNSGNTLSWLLSMFWINEDISYRTADLNTKVEWRTNIGQYPVRTCKECFCFIFQRKTQNPMPRTFCFHRKLFSSE